MNLLIVDDDPTSLKLLRAQLESEGHAVFEAHDGVDALALLERQRVDAVISDVLMPRMDGYRFCHEIRKHARLYDLPVIIYTSTYVSPGDEKLALGVGADKYLKKPLSIERIIAALHEVVAVSHAVRHSKALQEVDLPKEYSEKLVSKLKEKNTELMAAEGKFRALVEQSIVGIYIIQDEQFVYVNPGILEILGRSEEEMTSRTLSDFIVPEDHALVRENIRKRMSGGVPSVQYYLRVLHQSGAVLQVEVHGSRTEYNGRPAVMGMLLDITERKRAEAESAALQAQLQQAEKMESVGRLAGGVAHDYNNMLAVILGYAELALLRSDTPPVLHHYLTEMHQAATRSAQLTQQLLTFARKQAIQPQVLDINATMANSLTMLRRLIGEQVQFTWVPAGDLWPVTMDAVQMDQILTNLCLNARDAIGGAGTLVIATANRVVDATQCAVLRETVAQAVPGDFVQLTVTDSGCGMSRDMMAQIFEPFYTTKGVGEGTGLGLASVHGAVRQNGGFIAVASVLGEGATFSVYLPRCTAAPLAVSRAPDPAAPHLRGQETILVVEDEPAVRRMTVQALELQGYTVLAADHPREAIRLAQAHGGFIALLLTDVQMPEMSGYDLVVTLRSSHPYLKHLFMSGYPSGYLWEHPEHGRAGEGRPEDAVRFMAKPFSLATLTAKVREVLDGA